jgi:hypothetical protein
VAFPESRASSATFSNTATRRSSGKISAVHSLLISVPIRGIVRRRMEGDKGVSISRGSSVGLGYL